MDAHEEQHIFIKNMVCDRCKSAVNQMLADLGVPVFQLDLGHVVTAPIAPDTYKVLSENLKAAGFEMIQQEEDRLIEHIKTILIETVAHPQLISQTISEVLTQHIPKEYSALSKLFSKHMGLTIEKYVIQLKIEKVKELLQLGQLQFTEIADVLGYTSSSHLANQFKTITGMSMSTYKASAEWNRKTIDKIV
ncbi:helix-turn-helix domain-containing protein [Formosa algae]|uniref:AraC-like DNA-binding protein n=1 Tax=Formosa algae TaxID=225843 RepID=A0A9X0YNT2_9FLAO|nr:helix-turn-helix transcriptional regulator [Formosa algae]MBP1841318.1 AraC-like DNA-binding protein [Formosa algae]MDQ0336760.1 AraC-like DNA-binding protein [Formosa algae]